MTATEVRTPSRIRIGRTRGSRAPYGAVSVARGQFANPFGPPDGLATAAREDLVEQFRLWLGDPRRHHRVAGCPGGFVFPVESANARDFLLAGVPRLIGHDLGCWCHLDQPCHADVLLDLAAGRWKP